MSPIRVRPSRRGVRTRARIVQLSPAQLKRRTPDNPMGLTAKQLAAVQPKRTRPRSIAKRIDRPTQITTVVEVCCGCGRRITEKDTGHARGCHMKRRPVRRVEPKLTASEKRARNMKFQRQDRLRRERRNAR